MRWWSDLSGYNFLTEETVYICWQSMTLLDFLATNDVRKQSERIIYLLHLVFIYFHLFHLYPIYLVGIASFLAFTRSRLVPTTCESNFVIEYYSMNGCGCLPAILDEFRCTIILDIRTFSQITHHNNRTRSILHMK